MKTGQEALDALKVHEFDLPRYFMEQGLSGRKDDCKLCPIARYLSRETDAVEVDVSAWTSFLVSADGREEWITHPDFIGDFIEQFDAGEFPNLVLP